MSTSTLVFTSAAIECNSLPYLNSNFVNIVVRRIFFYEFRCIISLLALNVPWITADPVETGAKPICLILREAQCQGQGLRHVRAGSSSQLWQWVAWPQCSLGQIISPLFVLFPFTISVVSFDLESSEGKNCGLFCFYTVPGAIRGPQGQPQAQFIHGT